MRTFIVFLLLSIASVAFSAERPNIIFIMADDLGWQDVGYIGAEFFETPNIEGLPIDLPDGVDRAHYMAYKGMAAAAAPERLKRRKIEV